MNMQPVIKVLGKVHEIKRVNERSIELSFYGRKATYWPGKAVVLRNPLDGKFLSLKVR